MPPAHVRLRSMPTPKHPYIPFSRMVWTVSAANPPRTALRSLTPISVVRITSIEEDRECLITPRWISSKHSGSTAWQKPLPRCKKQDGTAGLSHAEWLGLLIDREAASRETKRFESRMRTAKLRHVGASPEDVDYKSRRGLDKAPVPADADWALDQGQAQPDDHWPLRRWQNMVGLRSGASRMPRRYHRAVQTHATSL